MIVAVPKNALMGAVLAMLCVAPAQAMMRSAHTSVDAYRVTSSSLRCPNIEQLLGLAEPLTQEQVNVTASSAAQRRDANSDVSRRDALDRLPASQAISPPAFVR